MTTSLEAAAIKAQEELITSYHELNSDFVDELEDEPSALEFMRYVAKNRPFVVRGGCSTWPAVQKWNRDYLTRVMENKLVNVALTPQGNADAVATLQGRKYFVKPLERQELFYDFIAYVRQQELDVRPVSIVKYAQTQNDNLRGEYIDLFNDAARDISWARIALDRSPEAINLWIGNSHSTTALHRDNYENIYCQIIGEKQFVLLPPVAAASINEQILPPATYATVGNGLNSDDVQELIITPDEDTTGIPCATWDPDEPAERSSRFSQLSSPMRISLKTGDMLYLPAMWYHKVSQTCGNEGISCAVNYWYDMEFGGFLYPSSTFIRDLAQMTIHKEDSSFKGEAVT